MPERRSSYRFGEFLLDSDTASLRRGQQEIHLPPKSFQVLAHLIENRRRVVSKQELVEAIWKDTFVTDDALVQTITAIRRALGDDVENPRYVRTKPRVGYQFIAPVDDEADTGSAFAASVPVWVAPIARSRARKFLLTIQVAYLALYAITLLRLEIAAQVLGSALLRHIALDWLALPLLVVLALAGVAVRLYLIAAVALDHPQTGRQYRRLRPWLFLFDELWACAPLLLVGATGLPVALVLVPVLVYGPFSQNTLMRTAYPAWQ